MTAADVVARVRVSTIWQALGGDPPKRGCARAFFRRGGNPSSVSLNDEKGCWHDFVAGEAGGVLALVQRVRGGTRAEALRWVADLAGVTLDDRPATVRDRAALAQRRAAAEREAADLLAWRASLDRVLRAQRDKHFRLFHATKRWIIHNGLDAPFGDILADQCEFHERAYLTLDDQIDLLLQAPFAMLVPIFREQGARHAA